MKVTDLRLGFAGTPEIAVAILEFLIDHDLSPAYILTRPDRPAGRGLHKIASPVKQLAEKQHIPVFQPGNREELQSIKKELSSLDVLVVVAYGMILPVSVLEQPRLGCINVHMSLLPHWRGAAPIQRAIEAGDEISGVTVMQMDAGLDTGPILGQRQYTLEKNETGATLHDKLAVLGAECLHDILAQMATGDINAVAQDDSQATYAHKISKNETWIDWRRSALEIERKIRAFNPVPVARTGFRQQTFRIWEAMAMQQSSSQPPGTVIHANGDGIDIATADGTLRLLQIQPAGKRTMTVREFLNGHPGFFRD